MLENTQNYINKCTVRIDVPIVESNLEEFPIAWEKTFYKEYPRFKAVPLKLSDTMTGLRQLIKQRKTTREFDERAVPFKVLCDLLYWSFGEVSERNNLKHRAYPSAGGRYPIECYVVANKIEDLKPAIYHYNLKQNSLEIVRDRNFGDDIKSLFFGKFLSAPVLIILTGVFSRSEVKYGTKAMQYICTEAGEVGQNIALNCEDLGLGSVTIGGFDRELASDLLDLDTADEIPMCCFAIGNINPNMKGGEDNE